MKTNKIKTNKIEMYDDDTPVIPQKVKKERKTKEVAPIAPVAKPRGVKPKANSVTIQEEKEIPKFNKKTNLEQARAKRKENLENIKITKEKKIDEIINNLVDDEISKIQVKHEKLKKKLLHLF